MSRTTTRLSMAAILALGMVVAIVTPASADNATFTVGDFSYQQMGSTHTAAITAVTTGVTDLIIPAQVIDGSTTYSVVEISTSAAANNADFVSLSFELPSNIVTIGESAFDGSTNITTVTIPDSVVTIGDSAFLNVPLTSIVLGASVHSIGDHAFDGSEILGVVFPASISGGLIGADAFGYNERLAVVRFNGGSPTTINGRWDSSSIGSSCSPPTVQYFYADRASFVGSLWADFETEQFDVVRWDLGGARGGDRPDRATRRYSHSQAPRSGKRGLDFRWLVHRRYICDGRRL